MFYGDWQWETPNERVIEMLMKDVGYFPYKNEDEMISKSQVPQSLYQEAIVAVPTRPANKTSSIEEEKISIENKS